MTTSEKRRSETYLGAAFLRRGEVKRVGTRIVRRGTGKAMEERWRWEVIVEENLRVVGMRSRGREEGRRNRAG